MGSSTQRSLAYQSQAAAVAQAETAEQNRQYNERTLGAMEQMLGTDEQVAGYGEDAKLQSYTGRYSIDESTLRTMQGTSKHRLRDPNSRNPFEQNLTQANALMDQAEAAARAGDFSAAEKFRQQAESGLGSGLNAGTDAAVFRLGGGSLDSAARAKLSNPMAQTVGSMVRDARSFQDWDWDSAGSQRFRANMAESGERSITAAAESGQRTARDFGLQRGAGRNALAASAVNADIQRKFGAERA